MESNIPRYRLRGGLGDQLPADELCRVLESAAPAHLRRQRWFGSKSREISRTFLRDYAVLKVNAALHLLTLIQVRYEDSHSEIFYLPVTIRPAEPIGETARIDAADVIAALESDSGAALMYDASADQEFCKGFLQLIERATCVTANQGTFEGVRTDPLGDRAIQFSAASIVSAKRVSAEQSNTSVLYQIAGLGHLMMKSFRKIENGVNPDLEILNFLTTKTDFRNAPLLAGYALYRGSDGFTGAIAELQTFVSNRADGWEYTLEHLQELYKQALQWSNMHSFSGDPSESSPSRLALDRNRMWEATRQLAEGYVKDITRLGQVTADLHIALASEASDPDFRPEPVTQTDVENWITLMKENLHRGIQAARRQIDQQPQPIQRELHQLLENQALCEKQLDDLYLLLEANVKKSRCHGDYHLGQVLKTENDFVILDFEGEPARPLSERRAKFSPLKDVAGMLRSFNYAAFAGHSQAAAVRPEAVEELERWATVWESLVDRAYLDGYLGQISRSGLRLLPDSAESVRKVLLVYQLDKAFYELCYEINHRPDWLLIPLKGIRHLLDAA